MTEAKKKPLMPSYALSRNRRIKREKDARKKIKAEKLSMDLEIVNDPVDAEYRVKDRRIAEWLGHEFVRQYPGRGWQVEVDSRNGLAKIFNMHVTPQYGWMLKLSDVHLGSIAADVARIGGEMLERSKLSRSNFNEVEILDLQRNISGQARVDLS
jgi:hypothetical protein